MQLAADTKIAAIIKANPAAVEAIAGISSHFEKLRNPLLRKLLAARVSIADAARIGGCQVEHIYEKLAPPGFMADVPSSTASPKTTAAATVPWPYFLQALPPGKLVTQDVHQKIASGNDPFRLIMDAVKDMSPDKALLLVNTFEPTPLLAILQKKGFCHFTDTISPELVHTYFWKETADALPSPETQLIATAENFGDLLAAYTGKVRCLDVRHLEMPQPMVTILQQLEQLSNSEALYVLNKRVPQFLLPQLQERGFSVSMKEAGLDQVYLLIYKK